MIAYTTCNLEADNTAGIENEFSVTIGNCASVSLAGLDMYHHLVDAGPIESCAEG